jgi:protein SCO1/2
MSSSPSVSVPSSNGDGNVVAALPEKRVPFWKNPYFLVFLGGCAFLTAIRPLMVREPPAPPVQGVLPLFNLTNQYGQPMGSQQLEGNVYVANFVFTSCVSVCPLIVQSVKQLQGRFEESKIPVRIVSFSVDPTTDTPEVLKAYGSRAGVDFSRWSLLTGSEIEVRKVLAGFSLSLEPKRIVDGGMMDIAHSQKLAIVDAKGAIRGFYGTDKDGLDEVFHRSQHVLREMKAN